MKNFLIFTAVAAVVSLGLKMVVDTQFLGIFILLLLFYGIYLLSQKNQLAGAIAGAILVVMLIGGFAVNWFNTNMPFSANTLPRTKFGVDLITAMKMDFAVLKPKARLLLLQRETEDGKMLEVDRLFKAGKVDEAIKVTKDLEEQRRKIEGGILPQLAKPAATPLVEQKEPVKEIFSSNKIIGQKGVEEIEIAPGESIKRTIPPGVQWRLESPKGTKEGVHWEFITQGKKYYQDWDNAQGGIDTKYPNQDMSFVIRVSKLNEGPIKFKLIIS